MANRQQHILSWLKSAGYTGNPLLPLAGDASFRSYYRFMTPEKSFVVMDAPPNENCGAFVAIADALRGMGLKTPEIIQQDLSQGLLLLTDFGDRLLLKELNQDNAHALYTLALDSFSVIQTCEHVSGITIPIFTQTFMRQEMEWFKEWFLKGYLQLKEDQYLHLDVFFDKLTHLLAEQPRFFMHRDYHSANLMLLPQHELGILDFQDAFFGPITYDLVSLLRDCYIVWPESFVHKMLFSYWERLSLSVGFDEFLFWFDMMSLQRQLKAIMTFSRKWLRDKNNRYLQYISPTLDKLLLVSQLYTESNVLYLFLKEKRVPHLCAQ